MKILVVGAGAVGGYYGALLARSGHAVTLVARGAHGAAIRSRGLSIDAPDGTTTVTVPVLESVTDAAPSSADLVLVSVKARDLEAVGPGVARALVPDGLAVPLLNGIDSEEALARHVGAERVVGGIAQIASELAAPGRIRVRDTGSIVLAPFVAGQRDRVNALAANLGKAGFPCRAVGDLGRMLWGKLLWNAPFNAICALTGRTAGGVLDDPELEALVRRAMEEVLAVARARGVTLPGDVIEKTLASTRDRFSTSVPSMLQDVRAGRPTEVDALQGAVVREGLEHGIPVPIHTTLAALVRGIAGKPTL